MEIFIDNDAIDSIRDHDVTGNVHAGQSMYQSVATTGRHFLYCIYIDIIYIVCAVLYGVVSDQETKDQTCVNLIECEVLIRVMKKESKKVEKS